RFVQRLAQHAGSSLSPPLQWLLGAVFHFAYAAQWGAVYSLIHESRPMPALVGGPLLAAIIYGMAFSPWGAAPQTRPHRPPERRRTRETLLHWTAALSFSLTAAFTYRWLRERSMTEQMDEKMADITDMLSRRSAMI